MMSLLKVELDKAFRNRWFAISLGIALFLAALSAVFVIQKQFSWFLTKNFQEWTEMGAGGAFAGWIVLMPEQYASGIFFLLMPLLTILPHAGSLRTEMVSGYITQVYVRTSRERAFFARYIAVFLSSAAVIAIPLFVNLIILLCFLPASTPEVVARLALGIDAPEVWAWELFNAPVVYVLLNLLWCVFFYGAWGGFVLSISLLVDNRVVLMVGSFLVAVFTKFVEMNVFILLGVNGFRFNVIDLVCAGSLGYIRTAVPMLSVVLILAGLTLLIVRVRLRGDQL